MSVKALREFVDRHAPTIAGLAALGAALDSRATGTPLDPALAARIQELLAALGGGDLLDGVSAQEAQPLLNELRIPFAVHAKLLYENSRTPGWRHTEPEVLEAAGATAVGFAGALTRLVIPAVAGLGERFRGADARFLDVGVGVGGLAIAMAQMWPELRITGVDIWQPSLRLARDAVDRAGLAARIELREQAAEMLEDDRAFDLAWVPIPFMAESVVGPAVERTLRALKPGGAVVIAIVNAAAVANPATAASMRLMATMFGGPLWAPEQVAALLGQKGFADVKSLPMPPGSPAAVIVGQRPL
jgi:2-polyprenyl-3-methyl-5-hydroxy-6-metoxy-1,4-benzoquinol methylase